jgi:hypothetical protein
VVLDPGVLADFALEDGAPVLGVAEEVVALGDDADAHEVVAQRDVPEPALALEVGDGGGAGVEPGIAFGAAVVGPEGDLVEARIAPAEAALAEEEGIAAGGVDDDAGAEFADGAVGGAGPHALHGAGGVDEQILHLGLLVDGGALGAGAVEQHLVKLVAGDLPGGGGRVLGVLEEVERGGDLAVAADELDAVFLHEGAAVEFVENPETFEDEVAKRHQRLADVVAREFLLLEDEHVAAVLRQEGAGGGAGGAAADDDDIVGGGEAGHGRAGERRWRLQRVGRQELRNPSEGFAGRAGEAVEAPVAGGGGVPEGGLGEPAGRNGKEGEGGAGERNLKGVEQAAEGAVAALDGGALLGEEAVQVDGGDAVGGDCVARLGAEEDLAEVAIGAVDLLEDFDAERAGVELCQRRGHVAVVVEQAADGWRQVGGREWFEGRGGQAAGFLEKRPKIAGQSGRLIGAGRAHAAGFGMTAQTIFDVWCCGRKNSCRSVSTQRRPSRESRSSPGARESSAAPARWASCAAKRSRRFTPNLS